MLIVFYQDLKFFSYSSIIRVEISYRNHNFLICAFECFQFQVKCDVDVVLLANHVHVHNDQNGDAIVTEEIRNEFQNFWKEHENNPLEGRNHIIASMCPQIFGCYVVKLAVTLVLIGGVRRINETETKVRGESHLLLVGDPGKKKNHQVKLILKFF